VLGPFAIVARRRPVDLVAPSFTSVTAEGPGTWDLPQPAPYAAATAELTSVTTGSAEIGLRGTDASLTARVRADVVDLEVTVGGHTTTHRSRRFGKLDAPPDALAITLTGAHLTALVRERGRWRARARYDLRNRLDPRDEDFCRSLQLHVDSAVGPVTAGAFGQLGLRDVRLVTEADGTPVRDGRLLLFTATHAGPGFFDAAHTGVWSVDPEGWVPTHRADLFFRRPDRPGVYGDNAIHLVRDGARWLVATSTWGDFDRAHKKATVSITLAESEVDLLRGRHVLDTRPFALPTDGLRSVGVWDPHLVRIDDRWHVGFVTATKFFRFHPALAVGDDLDDLALRAAATGRTETEGTTLVRLGDDWRVVASDGRKGPRSSRAQFPVFDLDLRQTGRLEAPYPTNIPWPALVETEDGWTMLTFNGTRAAGDLVGYGSHGDLVVMTSSAG
jgi:hypothetical protein